MNRILSLILALLAVASWSNPAASKSFELSKFHADIKVLDDGTVHVTESLTYRFDGRFTYAFRTIPMRSGVDIDGLEVSERGERYVSSGAETPGTYYSATTNQGLRIRWYYRAEDETRTFTVSYNLHGAVHRYADVVEYYHKIFGDNDSPRVGALSVRVELPDRGLSVSDVRAWAHGPLHGRVDIESGTVVTGVAEPLWAGRFFELRVLVPAREFASMPLYSSEFVLTQIVSQETAWAEEANRQRVQHAARQEAYREKRAVQKERADQWGPYAWVLGAISILVWVFFYRTHGAPHSVNARTAPGQIPSDHPPAVVSHLVARGVGGRALVATILDLADRGYLTVEETVRMKTGWFGRESKKTNYIFRSTGENPGELKPFEADLLQFLFNEAGDGREFSLEGVKKTARKKRTQFRKFFMKWTKSVSELAKSEGLFEPYPVSAMISNGLCGLIVGGLGAALSILTDSPAGVPAIIGGGAQLFLTAALHRRTPHGRRLQLEWKAFVKHLREMSRGMGQMRLDSHEWSRYIAIAIIWGMHDKIIPRLNVDEARSGTYVPIWYLASSGGSDGIGGISGLTEGFTSMVDAVSSTMTSASGAGGGASGGGGGGAGGGGAGAG